LQSPGYPRLEVVENSVEQISGSFQNFISRGAQKTQTRANFVLTEFTGSTGLYRRNTFTVAGSQLTVKKNHIFPSRKAAKSKAKKTGTFVFNAVSPKAIKISCQSC
jgi:hypothetical protein